MSVIIIYWLKTVPIHDFYLFVVYCTYIDIQKFNTKYLVMYKVQMHTGAISKLEYSSWVWRTNHTLTIAYLFIFFYLFIYLFYFFWLLLLLFIHGYCWSRRLDFHFCKKEYSFVYVTVQFDLIFLNSAWYKNALNTPGVIYRFCRIKSLKLLDLNALKFSATNNFPKYCPTLH